MPAAKALSEGARTVTANRNPTATWLDATGEVAEPAIRPAAARRHASPPGPSPWVRTTPGRWTLAGTAVAVALLLMAGSVGLALHARRTRLEIAAARQESALETAASLYATLSDADAAASQGLVAGGGLEPVEYRQRYLADIATAGRLLTQMLSTTSGRGAGRQRADLTTVVSGLATYSGLVESAREDDREGFGSDSRRYLPIVGAAYLRAASMTMRTQLLPKVNDVYEAQATSLARSLRQGRSAVPLLVVLGSGILAVAALVWLQVDVSRTTHRRVNPGLLAATLVVVAGIWVMATLLAAQGNAVDNARRTGADPLTVLSAARSLVLQAQADENIALLARGGGTAYTDDYLAIRDRLVGDDVVEGGLLGLARSLGVDDGTLSNVASGILLAHKDVTDLEDKGDFPDAAREALVMETPLIERLDARLSAQIDATGPAGRRHLSEARRDLDAALAVLGVSTVLALALSGVGLRPRLREYR